jgi:hypothetical protein
LSKNESGRTPDRATVDSAEAVSTARANRLARSLQRALLKGVIGSLLLASPFLVLAAVYWYSAEARGILLYIAGCFAIAGFLAGIGLEITQSVGTKQHASSSGETAKELAGELTEQLIPSPAGGFFKVTKIIAWLIRKDYRAQAPGRGRRVLVGAIVLGAVAVIFFGILLVVHKEFAGYTAADSLLLLCCAFLGGGAVGALLGGLSDSL